MLTRRQFAAGMMATGAVASGGLAAFSRSSAAVAYAAAIRATWLGAGTLPLGARAAFREVVRYATLAPNNHNTQPWKFRIEKSEVLLFPDPARRTPDVDPDSHHLFVTLGCAAENARTAGRALGMNGEISYHAEDGGGLGIDPRPGPVRPSILFNAIPYRQSTRNLYDGKVPSTADVAALEQCVRDLGVRMLLLTDRRRIESVVELVCAANSEQMGNPAFLKELKGWIRFDQREALRTRDGLFTGCTGNPSLPRWLGFPVFDLLVTVAFINQPVKVAGVRDQLANHLGVGQLRPGMIVRFGYGPAITRSLRRPVDQVLL